MSTYYKYQNVKVMMARCLMKLDNWIVYGYSPNESDSMIDYFSPPSWYGVAEKNGYILCVYIHGLSEMQKVAVYKDNHKIIGVVPKHMGHPPKCNWHIEKDGVFIAKGNGILKYSEVSSYFQYEHCIKEYEEFKKNPDEWEKKNIEELFEGGYYSKEKATEISKNNKKDMDNVCKLIEQFYDFIKKIDTICGSIKVSLNQGSITMLAEK